MRFGSGDFHEWRSVLQRIRTEGFDQSFRVVSERGTLDPKNIGRELIDPIVAATSARFDKPQQIREAVGLMKVKADIAEQMDELITAHIGETELPVEIEIQLTNLFDQANQCHNPLL